MVLVLKVDYAKSVVRVKCVSDSVMCLKLENQYLMMIVFSGYAPQVGRELKKNDPRSS